MKRTVIALFIMLVASPGWAGSTRVFDGGRQVYIPDGCSADVYHEFYNPLGWDMHSGRFPNNCTKQPEPPHYPPLVIPAPDPCTDEGLGLGGSGCPK